MDDPPLFSIFSEDDQFLAITRFCEVVTLCICTSEQCGIPYPFIREKHVDANVRLVCKGCSEIESCSSEECRSADDDAAPEECPSHSCEEPWLVEGVPFHI